MKTHRVLRSLDYPIISNVQIIAKNAQIVKGVFEQKIGKASYRIIGTGTSGAVVSAFYAAAIPNLIPHLVLKPHENAHRGWIVPFISDDLPIIVADDFMGSGQTMRNIADRLNKEGAYSSKVEIVIVGAAMDGVLKDLFPNIKHLITT